MRSRVRSASNTSSRLVITTTRALLPTLLVELILLLLIRIAILGRILSRTILSRRLRSARQALVLRYIRRISPTMRIARAILAPLTLLLSLRYRSLWPVVRSAIPLTVLHLAILARSLATVLLLLRVYRRVRASLLLTRRSRRKTRTTFGSQQSRSLRLLPVARSTYTYMRYRRCLFVLTFTR